ncbi:SdrD B-like domain-containing protein [Rosettibacter firmus]|uniref:SdrD B-like domain-containing protein n=1 Tax=Rosettibacter firmus TaxID=3111522 RepID=UPI00336BF591
MKKINKLIAILFFLFAITNIFSQSAFVNWPLTSNQNPNTPTGNIQAFPQVIGTPSSPYKLEMWPQQPYATNGQQLWTGNQGTGWIAGMPDYTRYIQFDVNPTSGNNFTVQNISFQYSDYPTPTNTDFHILKSEVWYAIDNNWNSSVKLNSNPLDYLSSSIQNFSGSVNVLVQNGHTFSIRIYPYAPNGAVAMTPSFSTHRNVIIEGRTSPALTTSSICGIKFNDRNGDGIKNGDDEGLQGWTINLSMGAVNMTATTGADGSYCFNNLSAGTYTLSETPQEDWAQTYPLNPSTHTVELSEGENILNVDFGNKQIVGFISGTKFNDINGSGDQQLPDEPGLANWTIIISGPVTVSTTTDANGYYRIDHLPPGTYTIQEVNQQGWRPINPPSGSYVVVISEGEGLWKDFANQQIGSICGTKFNDLNGNGNKDEGEPGILGWTITLSGGAVPMTRTTGEDGSYCFNDLPAGTYTLEETQQDAWQQTFPASPGTQTVILSAGQSVSDIDFGNRQLVCSICGTKFNDLNGNGINDNEPGLSGWIIELTYFGVNGQITQRDTTDSDGNYCFNNLPFATFTLSEVNKSGWTQTAPASGSYTITINQELNLIGKDFGNKEILNPDCIDFENNSMNGWQANNISTSFQQNGNNHYIQTTDQAGVSTFFTTSKPFTGNWTSLFANGCGSLCFDINFIYGGDVYNGVTPPQTLNPYIALEGAGFKASFVVNQSISVGSGWHTFCAPLSFLNSDGTLPSNSDGYWIMTVGTASDWNTLLTNVTKVRLLVDPTSYQNEKIGYDNICLKNTGDCESPSRLGSICGFKILDKNGDGVRDSNEDIIANWGITLTDGITTYTATTDTNGKYCFENLPAGNYTVSEEHRTGFRQIFPSDPGVYTFTLLPGENKTNINFSNVEDISIRLGSICGIKFNDINGDGDQDLPGETGLSGVTFQLSGASNQTVVTGLDGTFCFTNLSAGSYTIKEIIQDGWEPTYPNNTGIINVNLAEGQNLENLFFGNKEKLGSICGFKYNDLNGDGDWDTGEPRLPNWQITLSLYQNNYSGQGGLDNNLNLISTVTTDKNGDYCFTNVRQGTYLIGEIQKDGYTKTEPSEFAYLRTIAPGENIEGLNFGNKEDSSVVLGSICGIKFNDKNANGQQDPGELGIPDWQIQIGGQVDMTVVTDKEGKFCFNNLPPGEYKVAEKYRSGWRQTKPSTNFYIIQLASGQNVTDLQFGNTQDDKVQLGSICGTKFYDKNRDGRRVTGELGIANWTIYLDGPMNLTAVTDENGNFCFYGLIPGTYTVREKNESGWRQTKPSSIKYTLEVGNGNNLTGIDFGNFEDPTVILGSICGIKFNDLNGDGKKQDNEPAIPNWTITLSGTMNLTTRTDARGKFCFDNLTLGRYTLSEEHKDKWRQTAPSTGSFTIELSEDNSKPDTFYFGNKEDIGIRNGSICGMKYLDRNGDGRKDPAEPGIADWQINISGPVDRSINTNKEGKYCFENLPPGTYIIKEEPRLDWIQKEPVSPNSYTVVLSSGQNLDGYYFGNKYEPKTGCITPPSNMVAWWSFDFSSKDSPQDLAGYNNFGTKMNGPIAVAGKVLGALQFDGIDDYIEVKDHSELNFGTGDFSFDAWIKTDAKTGVEVLVDKRKAYNTGYSFFLNDGYLSLQLADGSGFSGYTNYASPVFVADGNWHHIAITVSRNNRQGILFYLDGVSTQFGDPTTNPATLTNTDNLRIGRNSSAGSNDPIGTFKGILDEIELFNRVLTSQEVQAIYNAGSAGKCKPNSSGGTVSGTLWYDINHNGVMDPNEVGLEKWPVLLNGPTIVQTETDLNGNFEFTGCQPGDYTLSVASYNNWSCTYPFGGRHSIKLGEAQTIDGLNFGFADDPCTDGQKTWSPLGSGVNGFVYALAADGNNLFVGGSFTIAGGVNVNNLAMWNGSSWSDIGGGVNGPVYALKVVGNKLYVGGSFTLAGNVSAKNIAMWDGSNWNALGDGTNGTVRALEVIGLDLYVGGIFSTAGIVNANCIAKWDITSSFWMALGAGVDPEFGFGSGVYALIKNGSELFVGGLFSGTGGASGARHLVKLNSTNSSWSPIGTGLDPGMGNGTVYTLSILNGELYAGGSFTVSGSWNSYVNYITKWDNVNSNWTSLGSGMNLGYVHALKVDGQNIYAGGSFLSANGVSVNGIAYWEGTNWVALGTGVSGNNYTGVFAIELMNDGLYVGGRFSSAGNINANNIAKYSCSNIPTSVDDKKEIILPQKYSLQQNYPNPFNPSTTIRYDLIKAGFVKISVYDILGREVRILVNEVKAPGSYNVTFDAKGLASGVYFYSIRTSEFNQVKKMILIK